MSGLIWAAMHGHYTIITYMFVHGHTQIDMCIYRERERTGGVGGEQLVVVL